MESAYQQPEDIAHSDNSLANLGTFAEGPSLSACQQVQHCGDAVSSVQPKRHPYRDLPNATIVCTILAVISLPAQSCCELQDVLFQ